MATIVFLSLFLFQLPANAEKIFLDDLVNETDVGKPTKIYLSPNDSIPSISNSTTSLLAPNPFSAPQPIEFQLDTISDIDITLFDINGNQVVYNSLPSSNPGLYSVQFRYLEIPPGIYFVIIGVNGQRHMLRKVFVIGQKDVESQFKIYMSHNDSLTSISNTKPFHYPSPYSVMQTIEFQLDVISDIGITLFDIQGNKVVYNSLRNLNPGRYSVQLNNLDIPSGIYFADTEINGQKPKRQKVAVIR